MTNRWPGRTELKPIHTETDLTVLALVVIYGISCSAFTIRETKFVYKRKQVRQQDAYTTNASGAVKTMFFKGNISVTHCMLLSTQLTGSKMMSPPGFQT